jgi:integrator complex subunit 9
MEFLSAADVKDCILKINTLNYAQEVCYNGTLVIKAFSSGVEIGSCNWILNGPKGDIAYLSSSCFFSAHAMTFDYRSLQGTSSLIYSDFSSLSDEQDIEDGDNNSDPTSDTLLPLRYVILKYYSHKYSKLYLNTYSYCCSTIQVVMISLN